jgi:SAM-dependent methyltransferase
LRNIAFEQCDAQVHGFPAAYFDLCISRFGVMFFADPVAAFANIGRALRPGARLVLMVWQGRNRNEWATAIQDALDLGSVSSVAAAFSLADPTVTTRILTAAGFASVAFADLHEPVFYGPNVDAAYDAVVGLFTGQDALAGTEIDEALQRLRALLDAHLTPDGVLFDSRSWIVTAHKATERFIRR